MLGKKRKFKKLSKTEPSFLSKLYQILNEKEYSSYIHWSQDGTTVVISDPTGLTKKVLPKFYNHHNYASFVRQLNMYDFHKIRTDPKSNEQKYIHSEFYKGKSIQEIQEIRRKIRTEEGKEINSNKNKILSEKKIGSINNTKSNNLEDKLILDKIELLEDDKKFIQYQNLIKKGENSSLYNDTIMNFLLEKLKQSEENHKNIENEINNLTKQNNNLIQQLQICNNKLVSQKDFCQKMKGLVIFLVTLVMRKNTNYKICRIDVGGGRENNNKKTTNLADFVRKYLNHKNKINTKNVGNEMHKENNNTNNTNNITNVNNIKKPNNYAPIIEKRENFTLNQNNLVQNLITCSNNNDESIKSLDLSRSFSKNLNYDLDLIKGNSSNSGNLFNSSFFFQKKQ